MKQVYQCQNVRNRKLFGYPYVNIYFVKDRLVVVPVMSRLMHNIATASAIFGVLVLIGSLMDRATDTAIYALLLIFGPTAYSYYKKAKYLEKLEQVTVDYIIQEPSWHTAYKNIRFGEGKFRTRIYLQDYVLRLSTKDAKILARTIKER